jgi:hypothetical protein
MDECDSHLGSLAGGQPLPLTGNPSDDSNQNHCERQRGGVMTFAATPPHQPDHNQMPEEFLAKVFSCRLEHHVVKLRKLGGQHGRCDLGQQPLTFLRQSQAFWTICLHAWCLVFEVSSRSHFLHRSGSGAPSHRDLMQMLNSSPSGSYDQRRIFRAV